MALPLSLIIIETFYQQCPPLLPSLPSPPLPSSSRQGDRYQSRWDKSWSLVFIWGTALSPWLHPHSMVWNHTWVKSGESTTCCPTIGPQRLGCAHSRPRNVSCLPSCWSPWPSREGARTGLQLLLQPNSLPFHLHLAVRLMKQPEYRADLLGFHISTALSSESSSLWSECEELAT